MTSTDNKDTAIDSEEEEDEDYIPEEDPNHEEDATDTLPTQDSTPTKSTLPSHKQKEVDDAFQELFGRAYTEPTTSTINKKKKKKTKKRKKILAEIFGGSGIAMEVMKSSKKVKRMEDDSKRFGDLVAETQQVKKETVKFAGQMMQVDVKSNAANGDKPVPEKGIDALLNQIKGPQKVTTIDKTNMDWDNFKDKTGLEEELKKKAEGKDAYLVKKDFLTRVDHRRFEQERDERERKRAAANSNK